MLVSFSWILPANCLGFLFIIMRIAFLEDVICANHIVQVVLMMSKPSDHSEFQALVPLRLMHMGQRPPRQCRRTTVELAGFPGEMPLATKLAKGPFTSARK